jgi:hypothetical protein
MASRFSSMSTDAANRKAREAVGEAADDARRSRRLAGYIRELVRRLDDADPRAGRRLRTVVGRRRARIRLDHETVDVRFVGSDLRVTRPARAVMPDGEGGTERETAHRLLAGRMEVGDAILDGRIDVLGELDDALRIFHAIEILLAAAPRIPALQRLSREFVREPSPGARIDAPPATTFGPAERPEVEQRLLRRLDLLP